MARSQKVKMQVVPNPPPTADLANTMGPTGPSYEQIARRAYQLWEARGRPEGTAEDNWFEAERELRLGRSIH